MRTYWISFASETAPLGVAISSGHNLSEAVRSTMRGGFNPGGGLLAYELPDWLVIGSEHRGRLIPPDEARFLAKRINELMGGKGQADQVFVLEAMECAD